MRDRVPLAGAAGAIGRRLVPLLVDAGYEVFGTTRSEAKAGELEAAAVQPIVLDIFDVQAVSRALAAGKDAPGEAPVLHVDAAAYAALLALQAARSGVFNIAEDSDLVSTTKARRELGWEPSFRLDTYLRAS